MKRLLRRWLLARRERALRAELAQLDDFETQLAARRLFVNRHLESVRVTRLAEEIAFKGVRHG